MNKLWFFHQRAYMVVARVIFFLKFKLLYYKSQYEIYILFNDGTKAVQLYVKK